MKDLEITRELKSDIESNQNQLKNAIRNHQTLIIQLKEDPDNADIQKEVYKAEQQIILVGIEQKSLLERLREEYKVHQKQFKANIVKNGIEERRNNLSNAVNRARKQNITINRTASAASFSDDSVEAPSVHSSPDRTVRPVNPHDVSQTEFLGNFSLGTHEMYKEMQNKRAERKRRSTANPHFLYGSKGWDFLNTGKRRRNPNPYLVSSVSPPHTRQSVRKKAERISPPPTTSASTNASPTSNINHSKALLLNGSSTPEIKSVYAPFPTIPNLPSGLTIERVSPGCSSPDSRSCITCRQPGVLSICEVCSNGFHISCHNRPLTQTPRQCPRCILKEIRTVGALNVPSGMSVSYVTPNEVSEKLEKKKELEEQHQTLTAELTQLQDRHSQLTISLRNQKNHQEHLLMTQQTTEEKIQQILTFISAIKSAQAESIAQSCS